MTDEIKEGLDKGEEFYQLMLLSEAKIKALLEKQSKARTEAYNRLVLLGDDE